ncbi:hypothetical protein M1770_00230 [Spiroplasma citri]|uniref:hypothetical protein n=1 Tax=Spiroplasma citri TaxID=2133 RepID=UPI0024122050|nr:hypothetical protein [Spiroplasma citri]WFG98434.1 hypothetical protein M1770_00230 [Spiroplasma citri]
MLSNYTYSKYAINKGYNDDVKLFSSYYFELLSIPNKIDENYWEFKNSIVQLNSSYFNFISGPIPINYWKQVYPSDKPFSIADDNYYFVVWRGDENDNWRIIKFQNINFSEKRKVLDTHNECVLVLEFLSSHNTDLFIQENKYPNRRWYWKNDTKNTYFKFVYHWEIQGQPNTPIIDPKTGQITDWNLKQQSKVKNKDNEIKVTVKRQDISENSIYLLVANYFNWLYITKELETNNIP